MKSSERYTEGPNSLSNLKGIKVSSISNRLCNFQSYCKPSCNFYSQNPRIYNSSAPENSQFQSRDVAYSRNRGYICYFHSKFCQMVFKREGPQCKFFDPRNHSNRPMNHLNAGGWKQSL